ncbi:MAG: cytochrome c oxidase subunit II [Chloroflexi bacterium]|nr:cytochrome c oxidase subunit II [Chloroflexota bacterium]
MLYRHMVKHVSILALLIALVSTGLVVVFQNAHLTPTVAATQALAVDDLFKLEFSIAAVILSICLVTLVYSIIVFRRRADDEGDGPPIHGHTFLEAIWTLIPLAIVVALAIYGALVLADITRAASSQPELEVKVSASQWSWRFEYPQYGIATSQLELPVNGPVVFKLHGTDVIHSFWVPEWRIKMDAVPGMETVLRITPTKVGKYKLLCAELCGLGHAFMEAPVAVVEEADFLNWVKAQPK